MEIDEFGVLVDYHVNIRVTVAIWRSYCEAVYGYGRMGMRRFDMLDGRWNFGCVLV